MPELVVHHREREGRKACLLDLPPMGVGVQPIISHRDLPLVGDVGGHPGNELQVVHPLLLFSLFPLSVAEPAALFIEGEALQG